MPATSAGNPIVCRASNATKTGSIRTAYRLTGCVMSTPAQPDIVSSAANAKNRLTKRAFVASATAIFATTKVNTMTTDNQSNNDNMAVMRPKKIKTTVVKCARCGGNHRDMQFSSFTRPIESDMEELWTHWVMCPDTNEPILMRIVSGSEAASMKMPDYGVQI